MVLFKQMKMQFSSMAKREYDKSEAFRQAVLYRALFLENYIYNFCTLMYLSKFLFKLNVNQLYWPRIQFALIYHRLKFLITFYLQEVTIPRNPAHRNAKTIQIPVASRKIDRQYRVE